ncbi:NAD-dependent glyceraldehyde-3-phosphate dehydrogenase [[Actinomadura] parvosata subsp. kistnae]|uniref:Type I glyceraldehyde-3-phosphate dehydrogenase n=1 Tax=[Actinomadura] parvosata subsp. kistnae TaxID=1909395 RepID=A0A1U9ZZ74_9ACTN|nr:type I glyceraldehyde-3-phosphate dehydrogenase [Nonomuraea sp. ATCC 55076]AQZ63263.1 type I glyceraldehyde-3-phosphate dehydrogenase [Nonomuraea sp. ATCC 55076]SPL98945.1 NAD-dependent glyceraldehyde-3-phosphate dehydrogenase [Actinomadura parvosata subsp. kistnae]
MRIGINGFGRIGRAVLRRALRTDLEIVVINDITDAAALAHLLKHDSTYGPLGLPVTAATGLLEVDGRKIAVSGCADPAQIDWRAHDVGLVIDATGRFRTKDALAAHLKAGARRVLLSAPGKGLDATIVPGVNDAAYDAARHEIVSLASCTTNCVAPMVKVLHERFGLVRGFMTTIHAYTGDQMLLDAPHKDPRRARSAAVNIVPTTTGAAHMVGQVLPELEGRLDGIAIRVPVEDGSITDLSAQLTRPVTAQEINDAFAAAARDELHGILRYSTDPLVSRDIIGDAASCVFDSALTQASGDLVKVFGWYDNEWGYANRLVEMAQRMA